MSYIGKQPIRTALTSSDLADGIVTAAKIEDGTVVAAEIASNAITTAKINADAVTAAKIADDVINSEHIAADSIDAEHYAAGSVDTTALGADAVTGAKIADDAINSEHYTDGSIDTAHIADVNVTQGKIADQAINEAKIQISNAPTNGYVLSAQSGNTGGLTWAEAGGGSHTLISTTTISNDATTQITGMDNTYARYLITFDNLVPITDNVNLQMTYIIGGSVITAANYKYANNGLNSTGGTQTAKSGGQAYFRIGAEDMSNGDLKNINGEMYIYNPSETSFYKSASWRVFYHLPANTLSSNYGGGTYGSGSAAVTGVQFKYNTGNMDAGIIKLYGIT